MTPADILPSLVELSIAIAGFSGIAVAVQERSERSSQSRLFLTSLLLSTFASCGLSVMAMVILASPLDPSVSWSFTSFAHAVVLVGILVFRSNQRRRGEFVLERPLVFAALLLYGLVGLQLLNAVAIHEPWVSVLGLGIYSFVGFGFFVLLLLELLPPNGAS